MLIFKTYSLTILNLKRVDGRSLKRANVQQLEAGLLSRLHQEPESSTLARMSPAPNMPPALEELDKIRAEISELVDQRKIAPLFLRLAFHDAFTYDSGSSTGGANGSIRTEKELRHAGNEGLSTAIEALSNVKERHPAVSHAGLLVFRAPLSFSTLLSSKN